MRIKEKIVVPNNDDILKLSFNLVRIFVACKNLKIEFPSDFINYLDRELDVSSDSEKIINSPEELLSAIQESLRLINKNEIASIRKLKPILEEIKSEIEKLIQKKLKKRERSSGFTFILFCIALHFFGTPNSVSDELNNNQDFFICYESLPEIKQQDISELLLEPIDYLNQNKPATAGQIRLVEKSSFLRYLCNLTIHIGDAQNTLANTDSWGLTIANIRYIQLAGIKNHYYLYERGRSLSTEVVLHEMAHAVGWKHEKDPEAIRNGNIMAPYASEARVTHSQIRTLFFENVFERKLKYLLNPEVLIFLIPILLLLTPMSFHATIPSSPPHIEQR